MANIQASNSLVKYNTPIMVSSVSGASTNMNQTSKNKLSSTNTLNKPSKYPGSNDKTTTATEDILNSILPPRSVYLDLAS